MDYSDIFSGLSNFIDLFFKIQLTNGSDIRFLNIIQLCR